MKLHHFSYITLLKLQHILWILTHLRICNGNHSFKEEKGKGEEGEDNKYKLWMFMAIATDLRILAIWTYLINRVIDKSIQKLLIFAVFASYIASILNAAIDKCKICFRCFSSFSPISFCFFCHMTCITRKQALEPLSLAYQKKDGCAWPRPSFFLILLVWHRLFENINTYFRWA